MIDDKSLFSRSGRRYVWSGRVPHVFHRPPSIHSPKQVARALFGEDDDGDQSTNKDVLDALASAGNAMA